MNLYAVIMAGGIGSRFWPESRRARPKQFLRVLGEDTLIQKTVNRLESLIPPDRCFVVTHADYVDQTREQLPNIPKDNILAEPVGRNTAPCILYAAIKLYSQDPEAVMVVLPADHLVQQVDRFHDTLRVAAEKAVEEDTLVTIGITPTHPATGYGYIQFDGTSDHEGNGALKPHRVRTFAEKPDIETAERFLDSGDFLWNSGMFIWRADSIRHAIEKHMPDTAAAFTELESAAGTDDEEAAVHSAYASCPSLSIDYGVMERADNVFVVPGSFGWSDVGDWRAVYDLSPKDEHGNALSGNVIVHDSSRCLVESDKRLIALVGIHDAVVVETEDAILICHRDSAQQVKNIVEYLSAHQLNEYV
ncbi:MAG: NTP transferase domain-containing protein [Rhodothermia bacterium]|nr:NTP transferase domain-containing protein [Rhodothermia bacterium]